MMCRDGRASTEIGEEGRGQLPSMLVRSVNFILSAMEVHRRVLGRGAE